MLEMKAYDQDYVASCRARDESQVAMFHEVVMAARSHHDEGSDLESALDSLESEYFNNMLIVLEGYFVYRMRDVEGTDGNPLNEVRVLARSLVQNGGTVLADAQITLDPERSVLGLEVGDSVRLTSQQYRTISNAFFRTIERKFTDVQH
ncbi:MAG: hypothetical protein ABI112_03485 [Terracoccus sp.]